MTLHTLGEVSLSLSASVYVVWLLPQLWHNHQRKSTSGLSFYFHSFLFIGYSFDLMYGFGLHMEWQYRLVTISGLFCLFIQHLQFGYFGYLKGAIKSYYTLSLLIFSLLLFSVYTIIFSQHGQYFYDFAGVISNSFTLMYLLPQIIRHYKNKSTQGLSLWFVCLSTFLGSLDLISAYTLQWNWPSIAGPAIGLFFKLTLLYQIYWYASKKLICLEYQNNYFQ